MSESVFARRTSLLLVAVCVGSFVAALAFAIFGPAFAPVGSYEANAFSYSAVGHRGFVEVLESLDIPVVVSRHQSAAKAGERGVLIQIEPGLQGASRGSAERLDEDELQALLRKCARAGSTLLVLPKWRVLRHPTTEGWCHAAFLDWTGRAESVLKGLRSRARVERVEDPSRLGAWRAGAFGVTPTLPLPQLLSGDDSRLTPLVACDAGTLVAEMRYRDRRLLVVSDPDVFANHGLGRGTNALLAVRLVEYLRSGGAAVLDETSHGFVVEPSIWRALFRFPLVLLPLTALLVLAVLLWTGMGRFGSPQRAPPPLDPGNRFLIHNTAELLRLGGNAGHALRRYLRATARGVGRVLHASPGLRGSDYLDWLERMERVRGVRRPYERLAEDAQRIAGAGAGAGARDQQVVDAALRIRQWKREILHGPAGPSDGT